MIWLFNSKSRINILTRSQNSEIRQIYDTYRYLQNQYFFKETAISHLKHYIQHLNLNFHLALQNNDNPVLNSFAAC